MKNKIEKFYFGEPAYTSTKPSVCKGDVIEQDGEIYVVERVKDSIGQLKRINCSEEESDQKELRGDYKKAASRLI